jgi:hypothetical protein
VRSQRGQWWLPADGAALGIPYRVARRAHLPFDRRPRAAE